MNSSLSKETTLVLDILVERLLGQVNPPDAGLLKQLANEIVDELRFHGYLLDD